MNDTVQHIIVFAIVAACVAWVISQFVRTLGGKSSQAGKCCSKGCGDEPPSGKAPNPKSEAFIPADALRRASRRPGRTP